MFEFKDLKKVHLEISNRCQASCPMCPRNINGGIDNPLIKSADWTLQDFKDIFTYEVLTQLQLITFCGTFGDPMMNNDLIKMCQYVKDFAPHVDIRIHTNGSARNVQWWTELTNALPVKHEITFALDGLADTHSLYRVGTNFNKVIENAKAVISAGGKAVWMFIRFKHNEHQVDEARNLSKELGFSKFELKDTRRFTQEKFPVLNKFGNVEYYLEPSEHTNLKLIEEKVLLDYRNWKSAKQINCFAEEGREIYIDVNFTTLPCCILAAFMYTNYDKQLADSYNISILSEAGSVVQQQVYDIIEELGGTDKINAKLMGIERVINNQTWQTIWQEKWNNNLSGCCTIMCSKDSPFTRIEEQIK